MQVDKTKLDELICLIHAQHIALMEMGKKLQELEEAIKMFKFGGR